MLVCINYWMIFGEGGISILNAQWARCYKNKSPSCGVTRCLFQECLALGEIFNVKCCCFSKISIGYLSNIRRKKNNMRHVEKWNTLSLGLFYLLKCLTFCMLCNMTCKYTKIFWLYVLIINWSTQYIWDEIQQSGTQFGPIAPVNMHMTLCSEKPLQSKVSALKWLC
jgi:hypothetical protein